MGLVASRHPAVADNANQPVGGEENPGLGECDPEGRGVQRQQQVQHGIRRQREAERQRRIARPTVGLACGGELRGSGHRHLGDVPMLGYYDNMDNIVPSSIVTAG